LPLLARAKEAEKNDPLLYDSYAREIVKRINYDFSKIEHLFKDNDHLTWVIRAYQFDNTIRKFLKNQKNGVVINLGSGLDTTFHRVNNGSMLWINIDLPDIAILRQKLIPDSEREITFSGSIFDFNWIPVIAPLIKNRPIMFIAAGVLFYFEAGEIESLFRKLASVFPSAHLVFDSMSWLWLHISNLVIMRKSGMDSSARLKWHLKKASHLKKWVDTIKIVDEYSMYSRVQLKENWSKKIIRDIKIANFLGVYNMVHIQF